MRQGEVNRMCRGSSGAPLHGFLLPIAVLAVLAAIAELAPVAAAEEDALQRYSKTELHMAVEFQMVLYAPDEKTAEKAFQAAFSRVAELNQKLSDYEAESELSRLSATAGTQKEVQLSDDLLVVLVASQELSEASGGAFDVTSGPLTKLWRRARRQKELPSPERIAETRAAVGYQHLKLNRDAGTAVLERPDMRLDLGGIAKGYAADEALRALQRAGVSHALVRASGDIVTGDAPPGSKGWTIGLAPLDPDAPPTTFVTLANAAVSTSGDSRLHLVVDGRRYSHLIDPRVGAPVEGRSSVSVIAPTGILADSLASAVSVLGREEGMELVDRTEGAAALTIWQADDEKPPVIAKSKRFDAFLIPSQP